jgi:hypothetical protein
VAGSDWQHFVVLALQSLEFWGDRDSHEACPHVQKRYEDEGIMWVCSQLTIDWDELERSDSEMAAGSVLGADRQMTGCSSAGDRR